jgi:ABC-type protease/lipase transport system fused ATPase/permease subunit
MSKGESRNQGISESRSNVTEIPRLRDSEILLKVEKLEKTFAQAGESLTILQNLSMALDKGEMVALVGPSG